MFRYLCLTKSIVLPFSAPSSGNNLSSKQTHSQGFPSYTVIFSGNSFCTIDVIFLDIANIFQIWSKLAGYQEFASGFEPIRNWELPKFFFWKISINQILLFQLVVYPVKMLQLLLLWQLTVERRKNRKNAGLPKANSPSDSYILRILREMQCILYTGLEL